MTDAHGTIELVLIELSNILRPLEGLTTDKAIELFGQLGIPLDSSDANSIASTLQSTSAGVTDILDFTADLIGFIEDENYAEITRTGLELISNIKQAIEGFVDIKDAIDGLNLAIPADTIDKLPTRLFDYLLLQYAEQTQGINQFLQFFEVVNQSELNANPDGNSLVVKDLKFEKIGEILTQPDQLLQTLYDWGSNSFDGKKLLFNLEKLLTEFKIPAFYYEDNGKPILDLTLVEIMPDATSNPPGLKANVRAGITDGELRLVEGDQWYTDLKLGFLLPSEAELIISPDGSFELIVATGTTGGSLDLEFAADRTTAAEKFILIGEPAGSRLEIGRIGLTTGFQLSWDSINNKGSGHFRIGGNLEEGLIKIDFSEGDGFLNDILGNINLESNFDLGFGFSNNEGLYFHGSGSLEIQLPLHFDLGIVEVTSLTLGLGIQGKTFPLSIGTDIKTNLGPLQAVVENMGLKVDASFPSNNSGNLGPVDLDLGFKPPNGVGLSLDAGVIKGGGYLFFDFDREEYAGALELVFSEWIALKAIGLVTTRLPDGSKGFSLVIIITVEFGTGIQLGFGFTLLGVGGLLGLNRTVNIEPLTLGVRTGAIESVMFPQDVVANAPRIISDLREFFPPEEGTFLIGPMAKIGWGTPTLVSASMGIILEFPDVAITILGVIKVVLPDESADVLRLQVNFIGRLEPSNKLMWFYAELFDSRVLFITLEGGMGMLVNWGDNSNFVFTVGGFHPRFSPPPLPFPEPPRIAVNILNTSVARIRIEGYFAVTSNTAQFGARAEMFFGFSAFKVEGHISFDALFQFNPFYFIFEFSVGMSVKVFGFGLFSFSVSGLLEGPTKWRVKGVAKKKITWLGPTIKVRINKTWGDERQTELPPIEVFPLIEKEFAAITNWEAVIPQGTSLLVALRKLGETASPTADQSEVDTRPLVLHPVGTLRIRQQKIPLDLKLDKVGNQRPTDANKLSVTANITGGDTLTITDTRDKFATGEFRNLDNAQKLSSPGFELYDSGIEIKPEGEQLKTSMAVKRVVRYETIIIDNNFKRHLVRFYQILHVAFTAVYSTLFTHFLKGGTVTKSTISQHYRKQIQPNETVIKIEPNQYTVAFNDTNKPIDDTAMRFTSQASAMDYMEEQTRTNPNVARTMHVIPNTEVNIAA